MYLSESINFLLIFLFSDQPNMMQILMFLGATVPQNAYNFEIV